MQFSSQIKMASSHLSTMYSHPEGNFQAAQKNSIAIFIWHDIKEWIRLAPPSQAACAFCPFDVALIDAQKCWNKLLIETWGKKRCMKCAWSRLGGCDIIFNLKSVSFFCDVVKRNNLIPRYLLNMVFQKIWYYQYFII